MSVYDSMIFFVGEKALLDEIQSTISVSAYLVELSVLFLLGGHYFKFIRSSPSSTQQDTPRVTNQRRLIIIFFSYSYVINFNDNNEWPRHTG